MEHDLPNSVYDEFSDSDHVDLSDPVDLVAPSEPLHMEDLDLADVEREICRLPDVSIARIVAEPERSRDRGARRRPAREAAEADRP